MKFDGSKGFKKGCKGGPGRPPMLGGSKRLTRYEFESIALRYIRCTAEELRKHAEDPKTEVIDLMVISLLMKAVKGGDPIRLEYILNRLLGRIKVVEPPTEPKDDDEKVVVLLPRNNREETETKKGG